jgi:hypothetical protein
VLTAPACLRLQMFMPTIMSQGTDEQQAKWIPMCNRLQVCWAAVSCSCGSEVVADRQPRWLGAATLWTGG